MGLFNKTPKHFPIVTSEESSMNLSLSSALPELFVLENFVQLKTKPLEHKVFDWYPDVVDNITNQMFVRDYVDIARGVSPTYYEAAPITISNSSIKLNNTEGVGILSEDALCFFWESRHRFNVLVLAHIGTRQMSDTNHFEFASTNEGAICRRSPAPEMIENQQWTFKPSLTNYAARNNHSLSLFFSLRHLQDTYLN